MRKAAKLALAILVLTAGGAIAFAGAAPEAYKTVGELTADPARFDGKVVDLKASVLTGSLVRGNGTVTFAVGEDGKRLPVEWASEKPIPEHEAGGTIEGRSVVVTGTLARSADGALVFLATDMQVGCASKYEPVGE